MSNQTANDANATPEATQARRWPYWLGASLLLLLLLLGGVGWLLAGREAGRRVHQQLADLGLGTVTTGSSTVSASGVTARNIRFTREGQTEPWLQVGKLGIEEPLTELATGSTDYDRISLTDVQVRLDADELLAADPADADAGLDLSSLELPSKNIELRNASVRLSQQDREDLVIENINANLQAGDSDSIEIKAEVPSWLKTDWRVTGEIRKSTNEVDLVAQADHFQVPDNWQNLPVIPPQMDQYIQTAGSASVKADVRLRGDQPLSYRAILTPQDMQLRLPAFDMNLQVNGGTAEVSDSRVDLQQVAATSDGTDKINVDGSVQIDSFPIDVSFDTKFAQLSVATIRKIVPYIPDEVDGRASGKAAGAVQISEAFETSLQMTADADNHAATYGMLAAGPSTTGVQIDSLKLGSDFSVQDLQGKVVLRAMPEKQSVDAVFQTFELTDLQYQLQIDALFDAELDLDIPLATVDQLDTWQLDIDAVSDKGSLDGQPLQDIRAHVVLDAGNLMFDRLTANVPNSADAIPLPPSPATEPQQGDVELRMDWPITTNSDHAEHGLLFLKARQLPADWALAVGQSQIQRATSAGSSDVQRQPAARSGRARVRRDDSTPWLDPTTVGGFLNADAEIRIDAARPEQIDLWQLTANLTDSVVATEIEQINDLQAKILLRDGQLQVDDLNGRLTTGSSVNGAVRLDVTSGELSVASIQSNDLPLAWALDTAGTLNPDVRDQLESMEIRTSGDNKNVDGRLAVNVSLREDDDLTDGWHLDFQAGSKKLSVDLHQLDNIELAGSLDHRQVSFERLSAEFSRLVDGQTPGRKGNLSGAGRWDYVDQTGVGEVTWKRTPINWIASLVGSNGMSFRGNTSGTLNLKSAAEGQNLPFQAQGQVSLNKVGINDRFRSSIDLQIATEQDRVNIRSIPKQRGGDAFDLQAVVSLNAPHEYSGTLKFEALPLSTINARLDAAQPLTLPSDDGDNAPLVIGGALTGRVDFAGQANPLLWRTNGAAKVLEPSIAGQPLTDIDATWTIDNRDFTASKADFKILGGNVKLVETVTNPQRLRVSIDDLQADELTALAGPGFPVLRGELSGDASINQWDVIEKSWADLRLKGASSEIVGVRLSDLGAEVDYRQQKLKYTMTGRALAGSINGDGSTTITARTPEQTAFPLELVVEKAELQRLASESNRYQSLKDLRGEFSAKMQLAYDPESGFDGKGRVSLSSLGLNNKLLTRMATADVRVNAGVAELDNFRADLRRGEISGRATVPLAGVAAGGAAGSYQLDVRQFDLERLLEVAMQDPPTAKGFFDARLSGQIGRTITGRGTVGFDRANFYGVRTDSLKVPIEYRFDPARLTGRAEVRQSTVRALQGRVTGQAAIDFGRTVNVDVDLNVSKVDTGSLFAAFDQRGGQGQGELSGQLVLRGQGMTRTRDLKGSFKGSLDRAQAFRLPLLSDIGDVVGGGSLNNRDFKSNRIDIRLANDRISIVNLQLKNSVANVTIGGDAWMDGRLDLGVVAQIDNLGAPSGLNQLASIPSPLTALQLAPVTQAADFLSGRTVFAKVTGTMARPVVRLDAGQQVRAEATRYFFRGRQILPNGANLNE